MVTLDQEAKIKKIKEKLKKIRLQIDAEFQRKVMNQAVLIANTSKAWRDIKSMIELERYVERHLKDEENKIKKESLKNGNKGGKTNTGSQKKNS